MTVAAIDRIVHHATIIECNTESYRRRTATKNQDTENTTTKI
jgi:DNA replication protein DnaC